MAEQRIRGRITDFPGADALLTIPSYLLLRQFDLAGTAPVWLPVLTLLLAAAYQARPVRRWLVAGNVPLRTTLGMLFEATLATVFLCAVGWGMLVGLGAIAVVGLHLAWAGHRVWRPGLLVALLALVATHTLLALGWVHSYLPMIQAQALTAVIGFGSLLAIRQLGLNSAERDRADRDRSLEQERFQALVQHSSDLICVVSRDGVVSYVSSPVRRVLGREPDALTGRPAGELVHPDDLRTATALLARVLRRPVGEVHRADLRSRHGDGTWHHYEVSLHNLLDKPAVAGVVANVRDITDRRRYQERLAYDAVHDRLTGLTNRPAFLSRLSQLARPTGRPCLVAVLSADLDGFKQINDRYGHRAGDQVLIEVARLLTRNVLGADVVARLGGDQFAVLLTRVDRPQDAIAAARRILTDLAGPLRVAEHEVYLRMSIGIAVGDPVAVRPDDLIRQAETAMHAAKRRRATGWQLYVDGLLDADAEAAAMEQALRQAISAGQMHLQYQPIVALDTGRLTGVEALVRWQHPTRGWLSPQVFIPLAEETGLITALGEWTLDRACQQVRQWQRHFPPGQRLRLSVNLSPRQLELNTLVSTVIEILDRHQFRARELTLEVTESSLVNDAAALPQLTALHRAGIRIALDDFGTGYSSLRYLTRLPVDALKIDRCFVSELNGTPEGSVVAEAVIRLAQILSLDTVAEGIETIEQARELCLLGCRNGQGYYFARPLEAATVEELIAAEASTGWPVLPGPVRQTAAG